MARRRLMFYRTAADVSDFGVPAPGAGTEPVAFDLGALAELRMRGVPCRFAPELLRGGARAEVWRVADAVSRVWALPLGPAFERLFGGLTLRDLFAYEAGYFSREAAASQFLIEHVLAEARPDELVLCQRPEPPLSWTFYSSVFEGLALDAARRRGLSVRFAVPAPPWQGPGRSPRWWQAWHTFRGTGPGYALRRAKGTLQALSARPGSRRAEGRLQKMTAADLDGGRAERRVLFFGNAVDLQNGLHLAAELAGHHGLKLLTAGFHYESTVARQARELGVEYFVHTQFSSPGDRVSLLPQLREAEHQFLALAARQEPLCAEIYGSQSLARSHFNHLFGRRCYELALARPALRRMLDAVRPSAVILGLDWHHIPRVMVEEARDRNIPTLTLAHAGLMDWTLFGFASDRIAAWGEGHGQRMRPPDAVRLVGSARYDRLIAEINLEGRERLRALARELMTEQGVDVSRMVVLVLTASEPEALIGPVDLSGHGQALEALLDMPARCPDIALALKPHPRFDYFRWYEALARQHRPGVHFLPSTLALSSLLPGADAVLLVDVPSDAALEAMLYGIPTLFLSPAWEDVFDSSFNRGPEAICDVLTLREMAAVEPALRGALERGEARERLLAANRDFLRFWIGALDGRATERTGNLIAEIAGAARPDGGDL